ncbi:MAG: hypothetical protein QXN37_00800 [Candidatus Anstonellaceae archaeon]
MKGQLSVELVVIAAVMAFILFIIYIANQNLQALWERQKQLLEAGSVANKLALAINRAAAGGNSTKIFLSTTASENIVDISVKGQFVTVRYSANGLYSVPLTTNMTQSSSVPLNTQIIIENRDNVIYIYEA